MKRVCVCVCTCCLAAAASWSLVSRQWVEEGVDQVRLKQLPDGSMDHLLLLLILTHSTMIMFIGLQQEHEDVAET